MKKHFGAHYHLLPLYMLAFLNVVGFGIIFPVITPLLLQNHGNILPSDSTFTQRTLILGLLTASFSVTQFFGSPMLGSLSDRFGRKLIIMLCLIGRTVGYALFALGVAQHNLVLMFISRSVSGFSSGDLAVAFSAIADSSNHQDKTKNFGVMSMMFGIGFIIGPFLGGKLSDPSVVSWFSDTTPFILSAILTFLNALSIHYFFRETLLKKQHSSISLLTGLKNLKLAWQMQNLRVVFMVLFLFIFGYSFFMQFFQVYLFEKFHFTQGQIGDTFAYLGICAALAQGIVVRPLTKFLSSSQALSYSLVLLSISLIALMVPTQAIMLFAIIPFIATFQGITQPNSLTIVSDLAGKDRQGEVIGIRQSVMAVAMSLPPILAGMVAGVNINLPIVIAAAAVFMAWTVFVLFYHQSMKNSQINL